MDHLRGAAGGAFGVVAALQQRHRVAARGGVEGDAGAGDAAADHDDLEVLAGDRLDRCGAGEHQARNSVDLLDRRPLGRLLLLARVAEVQEADEALVLGHPDGPQALGRAQQAGGAPVAGVAAGVGAEQDDVGGDGSRVQVLLVLDRVGAERGRRRGSGSGRGRASPLPRDRPPASAAPASRGRRRGSARARSGGDSAPSARGRAARGSPRARAARGRRPCACDGSGSRSLRPRLQHSRRVERAPLFTSSEVVKEGACRAKVADRAEVPGEGLPGEATAQPPGQADREGGGREADADRRPWGRARARGADGLGRRGGDRLRGFGFAFRRAELGRR